MKKLLSLLLLVVLVVLAVVTAVSAREISDVEGHIKVTRPTVTKVPKVQHHMPTVTGTITVEQRSLPSNAKPEKRPAQVPQLTSPLPTPEPTHPVSPLPTPEPTVTPEPPTPTPGIRPTVGGCTPTPPDGTPVPCW
jgi:hypothetical protein